MKINNQTRFSHPVLNGHTFDFKSGDFDVNLEVHEKPGVAKLALVSNTVVSEKDINDFIKNGAASVGIYATCLDTYFNQLDSIGLGKDVIEYPQGALFGRVTFRPMIWASAEIKGWKSDNIHKEFGEGGIQLTRGDILALGEEVIINVGREKLAPIETIFSLAVNKERPERELGLKLDADKITILVAPNTYEAINGFRNSGQGKSIMLNSVYLPAVMEVLSNLRDNAGAYESNRWYRPFTAKCDHYSIDLNNPNLLEDSQKLLKAPFGSLLDQRVGLVE
ncbi:MAG: hypothetical protein HOL08_07940 [Opitutae bacterium]|nr:hypothetical protein [Opitutae bacterium]